MNKQPKITDATRKRILNSFWFLFKTKPIDRITVAQISVGAEIHRSSFYRYYQDVYIVLEEFEKDLLDSLRTEIEPVFEKTDLSLPAYIDLTVPILMKYSDKIYRLLNDSSSQFKQDFFSEVKHNISSKLDLGVSEMERKYMESFITSAMLHNFNYWYEHQDVCSLTEINTICQKILFCGISKMPDVKQ